MTTVVIWDIKKCFDPSIPARSILAISDSRTSNPAGVLTDNCAKIFEVHARCEIRDRGPDSLSGPIEHKSIAVAIAGSTLVAHNVVFCLQQALYHLIGGTMPTIKDIAEFAASVAARLTKEVGVQMQHKALSQIVLIGHDNDGATKTVSITPSSPAQDLYKIVEIRDYPYAFGSGSEKFRREYEIQSERTEDECTRGQLPLIVFDQLFLLGDADVQTGGDLQMVAITPQGVTRFSPMRFNEKDEAFTFKFYGEEIMKKRIGDAHIGHHPWQLGDITN